MTRAIRKEAAGKDKLPTLSITVDMKRKSPTQAPEQRDIVDFKSAAHFGELLAKVCSSMPSNVFYSYHSTHVFITYHLPIAR